MKLNERFTWEEEDLSQPQSERLLIVERKIYVTDWLAMMTETLLRCLRGVETIAVLLMNGAGILLN